MVWLGPWGDLQYVYTLPTNMSHDWPCRTVMYYIAPDYELHSSDYIAVVLGFVKVVTSAY